MKHGLMVKSGVRIAIVALFIGQTIVVGAADSGESGSVIPTTAEWFERLLDEGMDPDEAIIGAIFLCLFVFLVINYFQGLLSKWGDGEFDKPIELVEEFNIVGGCPGCGNRAFGKDEDGYGFCLECFNPLAPDEFKIASPLQTLVSAPQSTGVLLYFNRGEEQFGPYPP